MPPNRARRESAESAFSAYEEAVRSGGRRRRSSGSISATHLRHITRKVPASPSSSISQVTSVERQAPPHTGRESDAESSIASSEDGMERRTIAKGRLHPAHARRGEMDLRAAADSNGLGGVHRDPARPPHSRTDRRPAQPSRHRPYNRLSLTATRLCGRRRSRRGALAIRKRLHRRQWPLPE
ncbi:unnamed protein product [Phaeothamnion confervicola]